MSRRRLGLALDIGSHRLSLDQTGSLSSLRITASRSTDKTRRDLQAEIKRLWRYREIGKAFEGSAPAGPVVPVAEIGHPGKGEIRQEIDGELRRRGDLARMI